MDPVLVISPHLDDAVLSCGQFLAGWPGATIWTVLAGVPVEPVIRAFDVGRGFTDSTDAMHARWQEDDRACHLLAASPMRGAFLDGQYRPDGYDFPFDQVVDAVAAAVRALPWRYVLAPLGIAHPDHEAVALAVRHAYVKHHLTPPLFVYEEQPARVEHPETVPTAISGAREAGWALTPSMPGTGPLTSKQEAIGAYQSQLSVIDLHCCLVPERYWAATR